MTDVVVADAGMVPVTKPGRGHTYPQMGETAARAALTDAGLAYPLVQQAYVGDVYGDSTCGQAARYGLGRTDAVTLARQHNLGVGGACVVTLSEKAAG